MATYRITAPDGSEFDVTAPDDATEEQVMAYAQQQFQAQPQAAQPQRSPAEEEAELQRLIPGVSTDPTAGNSFLQNLTIGAGKSVADTGRGLAQLFGAGPSEQEVTQQRELDAPLMATGGGLTGNILGGFAQTMVPLAGGAKLASLAGRAAPYVGAAATGAAFAGAQPVAEGESRTTNAAVGGGLGVLGQGIASGAGALATKAAASLSPVVRQSIEAARAAGIPLNVAQVTNSAPVRALQAASKYLPFAGASKSAQAQQEAFNRAVGRSFGADAPQLTDDVMRSARGRLSQTFNDIYARNDVEIGPDVVRRMAQIEREAFEDLTQPEAQVVRNQLDKVLREAGDGILTGKKYQSVREALQKAEDGGKIGRLVRKMRNELDDAAVASVSADDAARLAKVRSQWANLRTAEDALKQVSGAAGDIRPASLYPLIRKGATKEMRELAKIGQNVLKDGIGDSGTAQRQMYQNLLTGGAGLAAAGAGLGKLVLGGALAGKALNSNAASKLLQQGKPTAGLARLLQPAPRLLPLAAPAVAPLVAPLDIGTVSGYDRNDPRYRGD